MLIFLELVLDFLKTPFGDRAPHYLTRLGTCPVRFEGELGTIETGDAGEIVVKPEGLIDEDFGERPDGLGVVDHSRDFLNAIKTRGRTRCNEDVMRRSHIACHAAAISWILGRKLTLDSKTESFVNDEDAIFLGLFRDQPAFAVPIDRSVDAPFGDVGEFKDLRFLGTVLPPDEANLCAHARALTIWHEAAHYCPRCGSPSQPEAGGNTRRCTDTNCSQVLFPRTDPAVLMLVTNETCVRGCHSLTAPPCV